MRPFQSLKIQFVLAAAVCPFLVLAGCDDDPVRPVNILPACWKPLVADTAGFLDPAPGSAQSSATWSNTGDQVAFFSRYDSCNDGDQGIYIASSEGGARRRKIPALGPFFKWIPGDTELIINTGFGGAGGLVIYNLISDSITPLGIQTRFPIFDISDDGRYIYYEGEPAPQHQGSSIYEYDRATNTEWAIVAGAHPAISPNGMYLAYAAGPLFLYSFDDSTSAELAPGGSSPDWTPDGQNIVYANGLGKIFITDLLGNLTEITGQPGVSGAFGPVSVSPDGLTILYQHVSTDFFRHIWRINIDGNSATQFTK